MYRTARLLISLPVITLMLSAGQSRAALPAGIQDDIRSGTLMVSPMDEAGYRSSLNLRSQVQINITGMVARAKVTQHFKNNGQKWLEGFYLFPLPENAAVDHMRMRIGERYVDGEIQEKQQARKTYQKAKREGKRSSLLEQERPNLFTTAIANIGPGDEIMVEIEYQQTLSYDQGEFSLRFPMAVTPRYIPGKETAVQQQIDAFNGRGWAAPTDQVADAGRISPHYLADAADHHNIELSVDLQAGFPLAELVSPYHAIERHSTPQSEQIRLSTDAHLADRDFVLRWRPQVGKEPRAALFTERHADADYVLGMILPPDSGPQAPPQRDITFIIDTSGSMYGDSIEQAKAALSQAVSRLTPTDRFNIIGFSDRPTALYRRLMPADQLQQNQARRWISHLQADGGTEMLPALQRAMHTADDGKRIRQIVLLTDGAIGNEAALFELLDQQLGQARFFTIGIGSAPNSHFMQRAAEFGRGTHTYIGDAREVSEKMLALFRKLERPAMINLQVALPDGAELQPGRLPDLYDGEPLVFNIKLPKGSRGSLSLSGERNRQPWQIEAPLQTQAEQRGLAVLWARERIHQLMNHYYSGGDRDALRTQVTKLALQYHLVSKFTSLVAVDRTPVRLPEEALDSETVKQNAPPSLRASAAFPQTATSAGLYQLLGALLMLAALLGYRRSRKHTEVSA